jgi:itaconate CoA-transferase
VRREFYRTPADLEKHALDDPGPKLRLQLLSDGIAEDQLLQIENEAAALVAQQFQQAIQSPEPDAAIADISAGLYGYSSILAALLNRERTGRGERIDISMLECLVEWGMPSLYMWLGLGRLPERVGIRHNMIVPYGAYRCADGSVNFAIQNEREWSRFCHRVLQMPQLVNDERFATNAQRLNNRVELETMIEQQFAPLTVSDVIARLEEADIASAAVNDMPAVVNHAQLAARGRWVEVSSPQGMIAALLPPHNLSSVPPRMDAVPGLGEHTQEVLAELQEDL